MSLLSRLLNRREPTSANRAKERLQIIISHERSKNCQSDYLPLLQQELLDVIAKYVNIPKEHIKIALERDEQRSVLELNVTLPDTV